MAYQTIKVEAADGMCYCTLNRPEIRNAFNAEMIAELLEKRKPNWSRG